jgi:hypothetical protein
METNGLSNVRSEAEELGSAGKIAEAESSADKELKLLRELVKAQREQNEILKGMRSQLTNLEEIRSRLKNVAGSVFFLVIIIVLSAFLIYQRMGQMRLY